MDIRRKSTIKIDRIKNAVRSSGIEWKQLCKVMIWIVKVFLFSLSLYIYIIICEQFKQTENWAHNSKSVRWYFTLFF